MSIKLNENIMLNSKQKGNLTELQCITAFIENGCGISIPYGDNLKYDFIADFKGQLFKIQVKTASLKDEGGAIKFSCRSIHVNCSGVKNQRYSKNEIDFFATYWEGKCYLVPVQECSTAKTLRLEPAKGGNTQGINFAENYELNKQLLKIGEAIEN